MRPRLAARVGVVVVTGASAGIGRELVRALAPRAEHVALVARRRDRLDELAREVLAAGAQPHVLPLDVTHATDALDAIRALEARLGRVDVLCNNAGVGLTSLLEHAPPERLRAIVALNVEAPLALTRAVLAGMVARGSGVILNVSSIAALVPFPGFATYAGSKHFLSGFSEAVAAEVASRGVLVAHACPGVVSTEFASIASGATFADERVPAWLTQDAVDCARRIVRGLDRGARAIHPSPRARALVIALRLAPAPLRRWLLDRMALQIRRRHERALPAS